MRRARIEMIYHLRSADCASAYRNPGRAVWRLQRHLQVDVGLLPAAKSAKTMPERDFELHCLIQHLQRTDGAHAPLQILLDAMVDDANANSSGEDAGNLAHRIAIDPAAAPFIAAESATAVRDALTRVAALAPIRVPAFLIDDKHLLHGYASPAFLHDLLQTLAEPLRRNSSNLWTELSKWMS